MFKSVLAKLAPLVTALFFIAGALWVADTNALERLRQVSLTVILLTASISVGVYICLGAIAWCSLRARGVSCGFGDLFKISVINNLLGYLLPAKLNVVAKAILLRRLAGVTIVQFAWTSVDVALVTAGTSIILVIVYLTSHALWANHLTDAVLTLGLALAVSYAARKAVYGMLSKRAPSWLAQPYDRTWGAMTVGVVFVSLCLFALRLSVLLYSFAGQLALDMTVLMAAVASVATMKSFTPSGLFFREGAIVSIGVAAGFELEVLVLISIVDRVIAMSSCMGIALVIAPSLFRRLSIVKG